MSVGVEPVRDWASERGIERVFCLLLDYSPVQIRHPLRESEWLGKLLLLSLLMMMPGVNSPSTNSHSSKWCIRKMHPRHNLFIDLFYTMIWVWKKIPHSKYWCGQELYWWGFSLVKLDRSKYVNLLVHHIKLLLNLLNILRAMSLKIKINTEADSFFITTYHINFSNFICFSPIVDERNQTLNLTVRRSLGVFGEVFCFYFLNQLTASLDDFYVKGVMNGGERQLVVILVFIVVMNFMINSIIISLKKCLSHQ